MKKIVLLFLLSLGSINAVVLDNELLDIQVEMYNFFVRLQTACNEPDTCASMILDKVIEIANSYKVHNDGKVSVTETQVKKLGVMIVQMVRGMVMNWSFFREQWCIVLFDKFFNRNKNIFGNLPRDEAFFVFIFARVFLIIFHCALDNDSVEPVDPQKIFEEKVRYYCDNRYEIFKHIADLLKYTCQNFDLLVDACEKSILIDKQGNELTAQLPFKIYTNCSTYFENLDDENQWVKEVKKMKEENLVKTEALQSNEEKVAENSTTGNGLLNNKNELQAKTYTNLKIAVSAGVGLAAAGYGFSQLKKVKKDESSKKYIMPATLCATGLAALGYAVVKAMS